VASPAASFNGTLSAIALRRDVRKNPLRLAICDFSHPEFGAERFLRQEEGEFSVDFIRRRGA
jgi:hypothetical protein